MRHERRVVGHASGWQEQMNTCVCGNPWPCVALTSNLNDDWLPCPFCGSPAMETMWHDRLCCPDPACGAHRANISKEQWNRRPTIETIPCAERQDAYDAAAEARVRAINRDAERYRVVRVSKLISESIAPWDLDAACDGWIAARDSQKAFSGETLPENKNG